MLTINSHHVNYITRNDPKHVSIQDDVWFKGFQTFFVMGFRSARSGAMISGGYSRARAKEGADVRKKNDEAPMAKLFEKN
jgi:hypothetical protein